MRLATLALIAALTIALAGCGEPAPSDKAKTDGRTGSAFEEVKVELSDGRTVLCLTGSYRLNCDWEHAK